MDMMPSIVIHKVTASFDESSAAVPISPILPVAAANKIPMRIINPQSLLSIRTRLFLLLYAAGR